MGDMVNRAGNFRIILAKSRIFLFKRVLLLLKILLVLGWDLTLFLFLFKELLLIDQILIVLLLGHWHLVLSAKDALFD